MPSPPAARISHFTPRRLRIKVPEKRRDRAFFETVAERLATWNSVEGVETNPLTASVLIHFSDPERLFLEAAAKNDLFDIDFEARRSWTRQRQRSPKRPCNHSRRPTMRCAAGRRTR